MAKQIGPTEWEAQIGLDNSPSLADHAVNGLTILPGSAYLALAAEVIYGSETDLDFGVEFRDASFHQPFVVGRADTPLVISVAPDASEPSRVNVSFLDASHHVIYCTVAVTTIGSSSHEPVQASAIPGPTSQPFNIDDWYARRRQMGNEYGPSFQPLRNARARPGQIGCDLVEISEPLAFLTDPYRRLVSTLDGAVQLLAALEGPHDSAFVLAGLGSVAVRTFHRPASSVSVSSESVEILDGALEPVISVIGARLQDLPKRVEYPIQVAATFTAEPLEQPLRAWGDMLGTPLSLSFAPFNGVMQQLLDPLSDCRRNSAGANIILLRPSDIASGGGLELQVTPDEKREILLEHAAMELPGGAQIAHLHSYETEYLFAEIFVDRCYMKHGIRLPPEATVIDVGANIGMFSLFVNQEADRPTVFAFEPSPPALEALRRNAQLYGHDVKVIDCGVSDDDGDATFTYYRNSSVFSGFAPDEAEDGASLSEVVHNMLDSSGVTDGPTRTRFVEQLMEDRLQSVSYECRTKRLSTFIDDEQLERIDLLKIDAEKSELAILRGIEDRHWPLIEQIVIEVHDRHGATAQAVRAELQDRGFHVEVEEETMLANSGLYNLFATRPDRPRASREVATEDPVGYFNRALRTAALANPAPWIVLTAPSPTSPGDRGVEEAIKAAVSELPNVHVVTSAQSFGMYPVGAIHDPVADRLGSVPFTESAFVALATATVRKLQAVTSARPKVVVMDCDNTLWAGICGEDGALGVDPTGPYASLQHTMLTLRDAGVLLCVVSKNKEEDVLAAFEQHPDMTLTMQDLTAWRINWESKAQNIADLADELGLGLESFVFLDDNPVECAEVSAAFPQMLTLTLPSDPHHIEDFLQHVWAFDTGPLTEEDRQRASMYHEARARSAEQAVAPTLADFIAGLNLEIDIRPAALEDLPRLAQLTQRTNQFNSTSVRCSNSELAEHLSQGEEEAHAVGVRDRFGDYGLVGMVRFEVAAQGLVVSSFMLSCRVLGKGVEHAVVAHLGNVAAARGIAEVRFQFRQTGRNDPVRLFFEQEANLVSDADSDYFVLSSSKAVTTTFHATANVQPPAASGSPLVSQPLPAHGATAQIAEQFRTVKTIEQMVKSRSVRNRPADRDFVAPSDDVQQRIAVHWRDVLGIERVGIDDNFGDAGGTSLNAVLLLSNLSSEFGVELAIVDLFESPTVRLLAARLEEGPGRTNSTVAPAGSRGSERRRHAGRRQRK